MSSLLSTSRDPAAPLDPVVAREAARRRTFAIISHPDAGKTTLTEKFLLYAGCVEEAGAVRGRKSQRAVTSDWMELERERGISITSTVLGFPYRGLEVNLLDTPGHQDFSADTYRTLAAADCAVMVLDVVKGVEPQTVKLFQVCAARRIPILTFVNKLDRPGGDPLGVLEQIEKVLGIDAVPLNWPIGGGASFAGLYDRRRGCVQRFSAVPKGAHAVPMEEFPLASAESAFDPSLVRSLREEIDLLDGAGVEFDRAAYEQGRQTPVFFGSALTNFGIEPFLDAFVELSPPPAARLAEDGSPVPVEQRDFVGQVFKIQANLDPKHRDRVAFVRVCAGRFERDMEVTIERTGERLRIKRAHRLFARSRETSDVAYPGDVLGMVNPGRFRLGDTLCSGTPVRIGGQWDFAPEVFATLRCLDTGRRKQFQKGLHQLVDEGVVRLLRDDRTAANEPVLAAVGELQFDVVRFRMQSEYDTPTDLRRLPYAIARWIAASPEDLADFRPPSESRVMFDEFGQPMLLVTNPWELRLCAERNPRFPLRETPVGGAGAACD